MSRPTKDDQDALRILLDREDLSERHAEAIESLQQWEGRWTDPQAAYFDSIWNHYEG